MNAHDYLSQVEKIDALISHLLEERDKYNELKNRISPKPPDGMPFSNTGTVSRKVEDIAVKLADIENELDKAIDRLVDKKQEITDLVSFLPPDELKVILMSYVSLDTNSYIAREMDICEVTVWRLKTRALKKIQHVIECNGIL